MLSDSVFPHRERRQDDGPREAPAPPGAVLRRAPADRCRAGRGATPPTAAPTPSVAYPAKTEDRASLSAASRACKSLTLVRPLAAKRLCAAFASSRCPEAIDRSAPPAANPVTDPPVATQA